MRIVVAAYSSFTCRDHVSRCFDEPACADLVQFQYDNSPVFLHRTLSCAYPPYIGLWFEHLDDKATPVGPVSMCGKTWFVRLQTWFK